MRDKIIRFMRGRYGIDDLYRFLFAIYIILLLVNIFVNSIILNVLELFVVLIMICRSLSRKIYKRNKENIRYLKIKKWVIDIFKGRKRKNSEYVYKKCHHCKTKLKLPLPTKRGIKHSICPKCKKRNTFMVLKKLKIVVIR